MKRPKISRRAETRPYGRVSAPTGNCRKFLTQLTVPFHQRGLEGSLPIPRHRQRHHPLSVKTVLRLCPLRVLPRLLSRS